MTERAWVLWTTLPTGVQLVFCPSIAKRIRRVENGPRLQYDRKGGICELLFFKKWRLAEIPSNSKTTSAGRSASVPSRDRQVQRRRCPLAYEDKTDASLPLSLDPFLRRILIEAVEQGAGFPVALLIIYLIKLYK
jgi:hypothetical protein